MQRPDLPHSRSFSWRETAALLEDLQRHGSLTVAEGGRWYAQCDAEGSVVAALRPPQILLEDGPVPSSERLHARALEGPGRHAVLLLQAGAAALGLFDQDELLDHKAFKRYVVRGKGRAQPSHLKTRGKSRMGSRIRLRNAERLLEEVSERLGRWWGQVPEPRCLFVSCPVRLWADLGSVDPRPPVHGDDPRRVRIPFDVHVPNHAELLRVHRSLRRGRLWSKSERGAEG